MMKNLIGLLLLVLLVVSCEFKNEEELFNEREVCLEEVSFDLDVRPIIETNCAIPDCHAAGGSFPRLTDTEAIRKNAANIRTQVVSGNMPLPSSGITLSEEKVRKINCWVLQGALID